MVYVSHGLSHTRMERKLSKRMEQTKGREDVTALLPYCKVDTDTGLDKRSHHPRQGNGFILGRSTIRLACENAHHCKF